MHDLHTQPAQSIGLLLKSGEDVIELLLRALELHDSADGVEGLSWLARAALEGFDLGLEQRPACFHEQHAGVELGGACFHLFE